MSFPRRVEPEFLDQLPADDPRALRARRDVKRANTLMMNASIVASALMEHSAGLKPRKIVDLGSGDGQFMLRVARRLASHWPRVTVVLQDKQDIVSRATRDAFAALQWRVETSATDVFDFLANAPPASADVVTANLFLHHFVDEQLVRLLASAAQLARLVVACEPRRARFVVRASRLLWAVGFSDVGVHEAVVSARAGFRGKELSALWPAQGQWELHEEAAGLFSHRFVARRCMPT
ncbi:MAG TPA: methyltransferase domain-containing protein [Xanthobacteraceae bacterium]|jgi:SAM-dependent methyltransferase|nr:methyltransferase domain-containing protein [Xanthobacteraceae bacterium]